MNAHRINYRPAPAPAAHPMRDLLLDISLCTALAAGLVLSILQPYGAIW